MVDYDREKVDVARFPLSALLSQVLVAFTIEFDNEFEHQMPHRTTNHSSTTSSRYAPWLVSLVMWSNCMQFVSEEGVTVSELQHIARTGTNLAGMQRWGYIIVEPKPTGSQPHPDAVVRPTRGGRKAQEVWRPLFDVIERRWQERFGSDEVGMLRESLWIPVSKINVGLPDCLPILGYGLFSKGRHSGDNSYLATQINDERQIPARREDDSDSRLPLPTLLSQALLAFAIEFERKSNMSLAISANVLRVLSEQGVQVRDLPLLTGVSKEAISMAMGILQERQFAVVEAGPTGSRFKGVRLTPDGRKAQNMYHYLPGVIEELWQVRFGSDAVHRLRTVLERMVGKPTAQPSPLFKGLEPYRDGWRASVRKPDTLPHYPMVLHRGGFPDGS